MQWQQMHPRHLSLDLLSMPGCIWTVAEFKKEIKTCSSLTRTCSIYAPYTSEGVAYIPSLHAVQQCHSKRNDAQHVYSTISKTNSCWQN